MLTAAHHILGTSGAPDEAKHSVDNAIDQLHIAGVTLNEGDDRGSSIDADLAREMATLRPFCAPLKTPPPFSITPARLILASHYLTPPHVTHPSTLRKATQKRSNVALAAVIHVAVAVHRASGRTAPPLGMISFNPHRVDHWLTTG